VRLFVEGGVFGPRRYRCASVAGIGDGAPAIAEIAARFGAGRGRRGKQ
jgi:hypothetical protein